MTAWHLTKNSTILFIWFIIPAEFPHLVPGGVRRRVLLRAAGWRHRDQLHCWPLLQDGQVCQGEWLDGVMKCLMKCLMKCCCCYHLMDSLSSPLRFWPSTAGSGGSAMCVSTCCWPATTPTPSYSGDTQARAVNEPSRSFHRSRRRSSMVYQLWHR